jgi:hypothetical protein
MAARLSLEFWNYPFNHFLFLNSLFPSISAWYSNPTSISLMASSIVLATLRVRATIASIIKKIVVI